MGANLCSCIADHHDHDYDHGDLGHNNDPKNKSKNPISQEVVKPNKLNDIPSAIMGLIRRPWCVQIRDHKKRRQSLTLDKPAEKKISKDRNLITPQDWTVISSIPTSGESHVVKHSARKVHPSSSSCSSSSMKLPSCSTTTTSSNTLEPTAKSDYLNNTLLSKSTSGKFTKKVSFKDELNVIMFYSPDETVKDSA